MKEIKMSFENFAEECKRRKLAVNLFKIDGPEGRIPVVKPVRPEPEILNTALTNEFINFEVMTLDIDGWISPGQTRPIQRSYYGEDYNGIFLDMWFNTFELENKHASRTFVYVPPTLVITNTYVVDPLVYDVEMEAHRQNVRDGMADRDTPIFRADQVIIKKIATVRSRLYIYK